MGSEGELHQEAGAVEEVGAIFEVICSWAV